MLRNIAIAGLMLGTISLATINRSAIIEKTDYSITEEKILNSSGSKMTELEIDSDYKLNFKLSNDALDPFVKALGGTGVDQFYGMVATEDKGYIGVGLTQSNNYDFQGQLKGGQDAMIIKLDSSGNKVWAKTLGGSSTDVFTKITKSHDGTHYIATGYSGSMDKDFSNTGASNDYNYGIFAKYDTNGNLINLKPYFAEDSTDYMLLFSVNTTSDNGYILSGTVGYGTAAVSTHPFDGIIIKVDSNGNELWRRVFGGSQNEVFEVAFETLDKGIITVGRAYSKDGDLSDTNHRGDNDAIVVKYDMNGNLLWKKVFGGVGNDSFRDLALTSDGGIIAVGYTESNTYDLTGIKKNGTARDALIVKFDKNGNVVWKKTVGGTKSEYLLGIRASVNSGEYVATGFGDSNDGDYLNMNNGQEDAIILKIKDNGSSMNIEWNRTFGGSKAERLRGIVSLPDGGYAIAGNTSSNDKEFSGKLIGSDDAMVVKFSESGDLSLLNYDNEIEEIQYDITAVYSDSKTELIKNGVMKNEYIPVNSLKEKTIPFTVPRKPKMSKIVVNISIKDSYDYNLSNNNISMEVPVKYVPYDGPDIELKLNNYNFTNKSVNILITATDEFGEIDFVVLPDNSKMYSSTGTFTVNSNGRYSFIAYNKEGLFTYGTINVTNIDKKAPTVFINKNPNGEWVNVDIGVSISGTD